MIGLGQQRTLSCLAAAAVVVVAPVEVVVALTGASDNGWPANQSAPGAALKAAGEATGLGSCCCCCNGSLVVFAGAVVAVGTE